MFYADTDSIGADKDFIKRHSTYGLTTVGEKDVVSMKACLNSIYGKAVMMNNDYIVVHRNKKAIVIFKKYIVAVQMDEDNTAIITTFNGTFYTDEKYADVVKRIM